MAAIDKTAPWAALEEDAQALSKTGMRALFEEGSRPVRTLFD